MTTLLGATGLCVQRGGREVLRNLSVQLQAGQWVALVGANGEGKSTLLAALAGLLPVSAGEVQLNGRPLSDWPRAERARRLAWLAQHGEAEGDLPAGDVVRLGRLPHTGLWGAADAGDEAAVGRAVQVSDTLALVARRLSALSGGERQRVLLARLLATEAPVMLLDEPTTHLDVPHQRSLLTHLATRARAGACIVCALHDLTQALGADRVLLLAAGRIAADGRPGDPTLHRALEAACDAAIRIVAVAGEMPADPPRWVAVPR